MNKTSFSAAGFVKLLTLFTICIYCSGSVLATSTYQWQRVTITANNIPLETVFKKITQQTGISIYTSLPEEQFSTKRRVTVNFIHTAINEVMTFLLNDKTDLSYTMTGNNINIFKKVSFLLDKPFLPITPDTIAKTIDLSGKIVDNEGNPIPGASVKLKADIKRGTMSNPDGTFRFSDVTKGSTIVFSSIGFESKEVLVDKKSVLVSLKPHTNLLDEKVIIAYGSTTRRLNTGNIGSIKATDIEKQPVNNPLLAVQGRIPGIFIEQSTGLPGTGVTIRIQGINSYASGRDPFYVVDGIPYVSQLLPINNTITGSSGTNFVSGNPFSYINPADIESIEVLKDADATAIYGSRAANGAVLITTKKGKMGPVKVNLSMQTGWSKLQKEMSVLNTKQYLEMRHEALKNDNTPISPFDYDLNGTLDTTRDIDWQKKLIGKTAQYTDAQFSISGGTAVTQFLLGAGYHKETTVFPGSFSDSKASVHVNLNSVSHDQKFRMQFTSSFMFDDNKLPKNDLTSFATSYAPIMPDPLLPDGSINWMLDSTGAAINPNNPLAQNTQKSNNKTSNLISNINLGYEIIPGLNIKSSFGYNALTTNEITRLPSSVFPPQFARLIPNGTQFLNNRTSSWIIEPQLQYQRKISKGDLDVMLGSTISQLNKDQQNVTGSGFNNELIMEDISSAPYIYGVTINSIYKYNAIYGRISYNWMNKYVVNLSSRRDGSSRFGPKSQFHNFAAIGAAWIFSEEQFLQSKLPFLSFGKLRASYGTTGNDQITDYFFMDIYRSIPVTGNPYQNILGLAPSKLTNPYLEWEETKKFQVGLDLGFLNNRIMLNANYNRNRSSNQLLTTPLPSITGFAGIINNFPAVIQNTGWELMLSTTNIKTKDFSWSSIFNITIPKNRIVAYRKVDKNTTVHIGKSITLQALFDYAGVNDTSGLYQYRDAKGNLTTSPSDPADRVALIDLDPKFYGGLQNSFTYKNFSLDIFFAFTKKNGPDNVSYSMNYTYPGVFNYGLSNQSTSVLDRWQRPGDKATHQLFSAGNNTDLSTLSNSNATIVDASYIRLKTISISWQIPEAWKKAAHLQSASLFINAQNLLTITNYKGGMDPESTSTSLPPLRVISIGARLTL